MPLESPTLFHHIFSNTGQYRDMEKVNNQPEELDNQDTNRFLQNSWIELRQGMLVKMDEEKSLQYRVVVQMPELFSVLIAGLDEHEQVIRAEEYFVYFDDDEGFSCMLTRGQVGEISAPVEEYDYVDEEEGVFHQEKYAGQVEAVIRDLAESWGR